MFDPESFDVSVDSSSILFLVRLESLFLIALTRYKKDNTGRLFRVLHICIHITTIPGYLFIIQDMSKLCTVRLGVGAIHGSEGNFFS